MKLLFSLVMLKADKTYVFGVSLKRTCKTSLKLAKKHLTIEGHRKQSLQIRISSLPVVGFRSI